MPGCCIRCLNRMQRSATAAPFRFCRLMGRLEDDLVRLFNGTLRIAHPLRLWANTDGIYRLWKSEAPFLALLENNEGRMHAPIISLGLYAPAPAVEPTHNRRTPPSAPPRSTLPIPLAQGRCIATRGCGAQTGECHPDDPRGSLGCSPTGRFRRGSARRRLREKGLQLWGHETRVCDLGLVAF